MLGRRGRGKMGILKEKMDALRSRCREAGLKITPQRMAVYQVLIESKQDTVNRTLLTLAEIGAAFIVEGSGDVKRFDGRLETHQHFKCIKCKRIVDFHYKPFDNIEVPKNISRTFTVLKKTVFLEGICDLCKKRADR
jgi:Fur family peroxide stress response transcriptional regulator